MVLLQASLAQARGSSTEEAFDSSRTLNGNAFIPSTVIQFPFVSTYFGSSTGFGIARLDLDSGQGDLDGDGVNDIDTLKLGAIVQGFDLGVAVVDWLGLRLGLAGTVLFGADEDTVVVEGLHASTDVTGGVVGRILRGESYYLSAQMGFTYAAGKQISPLGALVSAIEQGRIDADVLLIDFGSWSIDPALMFAFAPSPHIGFQSSVAFSYGRFELEDFDPEAQSSVALGAGVLLDARKLVAPVAVPFNYQIIQTLGENMVVTHLMETGLMYSGRSNLSLGGLFATNVPAKGEAKIYLGAIRMFYYW